jgi:peptidoglycan/xylan/chitin deacetylase (PgdA/CDA1 family)
MRVTFAFENLEHTGAISYAAKELLLRVGIPFEICTYCDVPHRQIHGLVTYGKRLPDVAVGEVSVWIHISESGFWTARKTDAPTEPSFTRDYLDGIPVLFQGGYPEVAGMSETLPDSRIAADVIASVFYMLARCEEVFETDRDAHDRFPASAGRRVRAGLLTRPLVDEYALSIRRKLAFGGMSSAVEVPWGRHALCVTHDIDRIRIFDSLRHLGGTMKGCLRKNPRQSPKVVLDLLKTATRRTADPLDNLERISSLEKRCGICSTYFFLAGGHTRFDGRYTLDAVKAPLEQLQEAGHEIGLHGSYGTYLSKKALLEERKALEMAIGSPVHSIRQHYLRFRVPDTWRIMDSAGLQVDSSVGFADHEGFRAGTSFPFQAYDAAQDRRLGVWEVPLIVMDATLYGYRGLSGEQSQQVLDELLATTRTVGGIFTVLWHNTAFYEPLYPKGGALFDWLVRTAAEDGARACTIGEAVSLWKTHEENLACES